MNKKLTYGSLFSGVGGFDMGFDQAGYECLFQVEWDKHCQQILAKHWPDVPRWSDVQDVNGAEIPPCDVLIFGSPCQDLSVAGKRAGIDGGRSSMFFEATRIIKEMRNATRNTYPRIVVWENVPGALSSNRGADFQAVIDEMADCGSYLTEWAVLDAQHFGVPQRRRRIFLVAVLDPAIANRCPDPLFPVASGRRGDFEKSIPTRKNTPTNTPHSPHPNSEPDQTLIIDGRRTNDIRIKTEIVRTPEARMGTGGNNIPVIGFSAGNSAQSYGIAITQDGTEVTVYEPRSMGEKNWTEQEVKNTLRAGASRSSHVVVQPTEPVAISENQRAELLLTPYARSLSTGGGKPGSGYPAVLQETTAPAMIVRRLTPLECERLMGWPDDHTRWTADGQEQADSHRYKQCGNGVATPVAQWIAKQLKAVL